MSAGGAPISAPQAALKRAIDLAAAVAGLLVAGWLIVLAWALASIDTGRGGFFRQERIGKDGRRFELLKIRTMRDGAAPATTVTIAGDPRVTRLGRFFRATDIDELPQLINVLRGDMSLVGPRPDVPGFADRLQGPDRVILSVRPGLTGPATLKYRNEEEVLRGVADPERYNREVIYPDKVAINRRYIEDYSLVEDLRIIWRTLWPLRPGISR